VTGEERVFVGTGSNLGDRLGHLRAAVDALRAVPGVRVVAEARPREFAPVGGPPQGSYLNGVVELRTELEPEALLAVLQRVERELGRTRGERWGPRTLDLDLLLYGDRMVSGGSPAELTVPHPRLVSRSFVLQPLCELAPDLEVPGTGRPVRRLLAELEVG
jgi:2-amino-4-hydroxy-6-hydroxymethyldihydropteridine diphosphokinase